MCMKALSVKNKNSRVLEESIGDYLYGMSWNGFLKCVTKNHNPGRKRLIKLTSLLWSYNHTSTRPKIA